MAFDDPTRRRLANFVGTARSLLAEEFTRQLQHVYGLDPDTGDVTDPARLTLDNAQRETARLLRETMEHYLASADTSTAAKAKKARQETLDRIVREQAFTVLNRLCALRMAEARGLLIESIAKGYQSKGFQLYQRLAGTSLGETGDCYRVFLFSVFDEFAVDLPVLFDRFSPQGRLFPRETALLAVVEEINHADIDPLWAEDETIGWIYQYFNSVEERRQMRSESQAPRNSRELAVRNQFFTPRYVVEFLTDNTLGRIWYEMTQGATALKDSCRYLVRRPNEIFLADMELAHDRIFGKPEDGEYSANDAVRAAYKGNLADLPEDDGPDSRWISVAIPPGEIAKISGEPYQPFEDNRIGRLIQDLIDDRKNRDAEDVTLVWAALSSFTLHDGGGAYSIEPWSKLWTKFREVARRNACKDTLSQEELLKQPVHIPHRPLKDPRDIKMLDPACGSMHFGLYAFDLFERIYDEAWDLEAERGADAFVRPEGMKPLHETYDSKDAFLREVPRLIIERNIHGIDIDSRAVQIAGLSLWLRAQRSWQNQDVKAQDRPQIQRSNIVCAEPMPGEADMLEEFLKGLRDDRLESLIRRVLDVPENQQVRATARMAEALCDLVRTVWKEMELAGEAGSLLKIEESLADAIAKGKEEWVEKAPLFRVMEFGLTEETQANPKVKYYKSVPGEEEDFWNRAEALVLVALEGYAEHAQTASASRRRMFAADAANGFSFIDLCRKTFDAVLMNPPFGKIVDSTKSIFSRLYPNSKADIDACFVTRCEELLNANSRIGIIATRTQFFKSTLSDWRDDAYFMHAHLPVAADLGYGVLDDALVEAAAYVIETRPTASADSGVFVSALDATNKSAALTASLSNVARVISDSHVFYVPLTSLRSLPGHQIAYSISPAYRRAFAHFSPLEPGYAEVKTGLNTGDDFRFVRLAWEVPEERIFTSARVSSGPVWCQFAKGGEYSPYFADVHLLVDWTDDGYALSQFPGAYLRNTSSYFTPGITYSVRTTSNFSPRLLPNGCIFGHKGNLIIPSSRDRTYALCGILMTRVVQGLIELFMYSGDSATSGSAARSYEVGILKPIPIPTLTDAQVAELSASVREIWRYTALRRRRSDTSRYFVPPVMSSCNSLAELVSLVMEEDHIAALAALDHSYRIETVIRSAYRLDAADCEELDASMGAHPCALPKVSINDVQELETQLSARIDDVIDAAVEEEGGSRALTKKSYFADRRLELLAATFGTHPECVVQAQRDNGLQPHRDLERVATSVVSYIAGCAFGRWDIGFASGEVEQPDTPDPLSAMPKAPVGAACRRETHQRSILSGDAQDREGFVGQMRRMMETIWGDKAAVLEQEITGILSSVDLPAYLSTAFFSNHLAEYSQSRRYAPIYWPLSTPVRFLHALAVLPP
jgi:hypothetical protein